MLLIVLSVLAIGLAVAVPVWQTQIQREKEEELIFRGRQIVEAVRLYLSRHPGRYPRSLQELFEERCLRRIYKDPMTPSGEWNYILLPGDAGTGGQGAASRVLLVPPALMSTIQMPQLIGVASPSPKKSFRIYEQGQTYNEWLFFYGRDPKNRPQVIRLGPGRTPR